MLVITRSIRGPSRARRTWSEETLGGRHHAGARPSLAGQTRLAYLVGDLIVDPVRIQGVEFRAQLRRTYDLVGR